MKKLFEILENFSFDFEGLLQSAVAKRILFFINWFLFTISINMMFDIETNGFWEGTLFALVSLFFYGIVAGFFRTWFKTFPESRFKYITQIRNEMSDVSSFYSIRDERYFAEACFLFSRTYRSVKDKLHAFLPEFFIYVAKFGNDIFAEPFRIWTKWFKNPIYEMPSDEGINEKSGKLKTNWLARLGIVVSALFVFVAWNHFDFSHKWNPEAEMQKAWFAGNNSFERSYILVRLGAEDTVSRQYLYYFQELQNWCKFENSSSMESRYKEIYNDLNNGTLLREEVIEAQYAPAIDSRELHWFAEKANWELWVMTGLIFTGLFFLFGIGQYKEKSVFHIFMNFVLKNKVEHTINYPSELYPVYHEKILKTGVWMALLLFIADHDFSWLTMNAVDDYGVPYINSRMVIIVSLGVIFYIQLMKAISAIYECKIQNPRILGYEKTQGFAPRVFLENNAWLITTVVILSTLMSISVYEVSSIMLVKLFGNFFDEITLIHIFSITNIVLMILGSIQFYRLVRKPRIVWYLGKVSTIEVGHSWMLPVTLMIIYWFLLGDNYLFTLGLHLIDEPENFWLSYIWTWSGLIGLIIFGLGVVVRMLVGKGIFFVLLLGVILLVSWNLGIWYFLVVTIWTIIFVLWFLTETYKSED